MPACNWVNVVELKGNLTILKPSRKMRKHKRLRSNIELLYLLSKEKKGESLRRLRHKKRQMRGQGAKMKWETSRILWHSKGFKLQKDNRLPQKSSRKKKEWWGETRQRVVRVFQHRKSQRLVKTMRMIFNSIFLRIGLTNKLSLIRRKWSASIRLK